SRACAAGNRLQETFSQPPHTSQRLWSLMVLVALFGLPSLILRLGGIHPDPLIGSAIHGIGILSAAFLLTWGAETAEIDLGQGLAIAIIAFIAVLPEYAVDAVLAWKAGADPVVAEQGLAIANLTGGNRLLIGVGWPVVFVIFFYRTKLKELFVDRHRALDMVFLAVATTYVIFIPLRHALTLADSIILITLFFIYLYFISKVESEEIELVGPARAMGALPTWRRRAAATTVLIYAAAVIIAAAEPFAEGLVSTGQQFGVSEFFLIQWVAPLASESPEVLVASLLAWRGRHAAGMGALISSKVNQWTLLVGSLPLAFMLSSGDWGITEGLPLNTIQRDEIFLTAAQSAFAIAVFVNLSMNRAESALLFLLFATQLFITYEPARVLYGVGYLVLCAVLLFLHRRAVPSLLRDAVAVARGELTEAEQPPGRFASPPHRD
ncbi:MAG: sodium:proton exchanger, partial [Dehalococcoidia bacterium]|nr:sodium:proton exchanger [Dehalococcoidia bacterium]